MPLKELDTKRLASYLLGEKLRVKCCLSSYLYFGNRFLMGVGVAGASWTLMYLLLEVLSSVSNTVRNSNNKPHERGSLRCCNDELLEVDEVHEHLLRYGFLPGYTTWTLHGELATPPTSPSTSVHETSFVEDDMIGLVRDAFGLSSFPSNHENTEEAGLDGEVDESAKTSDHNVEDIPPYKKLLEQRDKELYPGCKFSSLSFTLRLYHIMVLPP
ncbi:hypothetical protein CTI12_AA252980 [Artemisia annua]|uniref:Transposase-associated domain-containing protein n=1 Tax=Artemisia annua TaxID=35608 RepID=A0A2U1NLG4_ARTAN|nr:hypothetical protein CTI12_AA252980 [Artemisia annua]